MTDEAADYFYQSVVRNADNIEAKVGLKRTGQYVLDNMLSDFFKANASNDFRTATYTYIDAQKFYQKLADVGVSLDFPNYYAADFEMQNRNI